MSLYHKPSFYANLTTLISIVRPFFLRLKAWACIIPIYRFHSCLDLHQIKYMSTIIWSEFKDEPCSYIFFYKSYDS